MVGRRPCPPTVSGMGHLDPDLRQRLEGARVARLATVRPDARPHIVPITFALDGDAIVTAVDHKPKSTTSLQRLRNIQASPVASVLIDHYEEDWSHLWWVRADGTARVVSEGAVRDQAVGWLVDKYAHYRERPPSGPLIVVVVERWTAWSA